MFDQPNFQAQSIFTSRISWVMLNPQPLPPKVARLGLFG